MTDNRKKLVARRRRGGPLPYQSIDQLLAQLKGQDAESVLNEWGLAAQLQMQLAERMLAAELKHHLNSEAAVAGDPGIRPGRSSSRKKTRTILTSSGALVLNVERCRGFRPRLVANWKRRLPQFDDNVIRAIIPDLTY